MKRYGTYDDSMSPRSVFNILRAILRENIAAFCT